MIFRDAIHLMSINNRKNDVTAKIGINIMPKPTLIFLLMSILIVILHLVPLILSNLTTVLLHILLVLSTFKSTSIPILFLQKKRFVVQWRFSIYGFAIDTPRIWYRWKHIEFSVKLTQIVFYGHDKLSTILYVNNIYLSTGKTFSVFVLELDIRMCILMFSTIITTNIITLLNH